MDKNNPLQGETQAKFSIDLNHEIMREATVHSNIKQDIIVTTEDKVNIALKRYLEKVENKKDWIAPLGIFITLLLVPLTTEKFKNTFSIPAPVWQAGCYIATIIFFGWFIFSVKKAWMGRKISTDSIVNELKNARAGGKNEGMP